jgi:hypothetical protein
MNDKRLWLNLCILALVALFAGWLHDAMLAAIAALWAGLFISIRIAGYCLANNRRVLAAALLGWPIVAAVFIVCLLLRSNVK